MLCSSCANLVFPQVEFWQQRLVVDGTYVSIELWDTGMPLTGASLYVFKFLTPFLLAGQQRFDSLAPMYYKGADAAIILYDATSPFSWVSKELLSLYSY